MAWRSVANDFTWDVLTNVVLLSMAMPKPVTSPSSTDWGCWVDLKRSRRIQQVLQVLQVLPVLPWVLQEPHQRPQPSLDGELHVLQVLWKVWSICTLEIFRSVTAACRMLPSWWLAWLLSLHLTRKRLALQWSLQDLFEMAGWWRCKAATWLAMLRIVCDRWCWMAFRSSATSPLAELRPEMIWRMLWKAMESYGMLSDLNSKISTS